MGEVYRAKDTKLGREVAIKVLPRHLQQDEDALARFEREAKIISGLSHPHVLTIHEVGKVRVRGDWRATHYMVTELIDGSTLRDLMGKEVDGRKLVEYMAQVADGLQKAHAAGVVHRDLKPENIMISSDGYAKVLDFGLAKIVRPLVGTGEYVARVTEKFQTQRGIVIGTLGYMSPEQVQGKPLDHRSDIFSFGCILYEILSGKRAFEADGVVDTLHHILHSPAPALSSHITIELRRIVDKCLTKEIAARFDSMRSVAAAIRESLREYDGEVRPPQKKTKSVSSRGSSRIKSLAVLPFVNASSDPEMEYLSDGITESVIHTMSRVGKRLRVMARTTVFSYKGKSPTPQQLATDLGVTSVVTGRVQRHGETIIISIELVSTKDGSQIWGNRFRNEFSNIFDVQDEISEQISEQLRLQLTPAEKKRLVHRPTKKGEAYELYLKGRFHANKRTTSGLKSAIREFERAIEIDPSYTLAHVGLADCHIVLACRFLESPHEAYPHSEVEASRAIEIDPALSEPHATLGMISSNYKWDWARADREFKKAISIDPSNATAHHWYSLFLNSMERLDDSLQEARAAIELEPLGLLMRCHYAEVLYFQGRYDEALDHVTKSLEIENYFLAHLLKGRVLLEQGLLADAVASYEKAISMEGRYPELVAALGNVYGRMGEKAKAKTILEELEAISNSQFVAPSFFAEVHLGIGNIAKAIKCVEQMFVLRAELSDVLVGPRFSTLRADPRWAVMLQRVGFPDRSSLRSPAYASTATI